ncbi:hypothetical protein IJ425_07025 [bacterium]|nr:hypothetical protein [bacterium]
MKLNSSNNNLNFTSVTPIIASKGALSILKKGLVQAQKTGYILVDMTQACIDNIKTNPMHGWAKYKDKQIGYLITGDEFIKCAKKEKGWRTKEEIVTRFDRSPIYLTPNSCTSIDFLIQRVDAFRNKI